MIISARMLLEDLRIAAQQCDCGPSQREIVRTHAALREALDAVPNDLQATRLAMARANEVLEAYAQFEGAA